ncbi:MAG: hypothetical protein SV062_06045 [Thermodesulfobacteriota bacterium]|nr:hypothetical protein [Thermodesulfobacteriota bacterium]
MLKKPELSIAAQPFIKLWDRTKLIFKNILPATASNIDSLGIEDLSMDGLSADWQGKGNLILNSLAESETPVIIFMDEFPLLINRLLKGSDNKIIPECLQVTDTFIS